MLVLTRRLNEKLVIGEAVVTIVSVGEDKVRLGVDAPRDVAIWRQEIVDRRGGTIPESHGGQNDDEKTDD